MKPGRYILLCMLVSALAVTAGFGQSKKEKDRAKKLQQEADKAYNVKNYRAAADTYGQSLALVPKNATGHYYKGMSHLNLNEKDAALNEFAIALTQGYKPIEIYRARAYANFAAKDYNAAIEDVNRALALMPQDLLLLKSAGEINMLRKDYPAALDALKRASTAAPADGDVYFHMAQVYFGQNNTQLQLEMADKALKNGTRFVGDAHYILADANQKLRNTPAAIVNYQKAINAKPDNYIAYRSLSEAFRTEGRYEDAISTSKLGLKAFPNDGYLWTDLSWYYSLAGRADDAVTAARSAITILPGEYMGYTNLCRAYNDSKKYDDAIRECNNALRLKPGDGETYFYLARAYDFKGRTADATKYYRSAVSGLGAYTKQNPGYSDGWYLLGNAYFADNQFDKAVEAYQQCLKLSPRFAKARFNLAQVHIRKKNKVGALEQYNSLLAMDAALAALLKPQIDRL